MVAFALWITLLYVPGIMRDGRVWTKGITVQGSVTGDCRTQISILPVSTCQLDISYRLPGGTAERASTHAMLFAGLDDGDKPLIKVDPQDPQAIAISWFADHSILELVDETGSIRCAAMAMEMSYAHAWNLLNSTRQTFGAPLITATAGGSRGGGTKLTEFGRMVVKEYRNVERRARGNCNIT